MFVGGLAAEVTEKDFHDYFAQFGVVKDAVVMVDRATNRSRFVLFSPYMSTLHCFNTRTVYIRTPMIYNTEVLVSSHLKMKTVLRLCYELRMRSWESGSK